MAKPPPTRPSNPSPAPEVFPSGLFHYDRGLKLTSLDLALDMTRRQPRGFISHAHADHFGRHVWSASSPHTAVLLQTRFGHAVSQTWEFGETRHWGSWRLRLHPAGHVLGSAMLWGEDQETGRSLLFTGDVQLRASRTAERAAPPKADILLTECTYGEPRFVFPPRRETEERLLDMVGNSLQLGRTPVVHAYALGKAQEAAKLFADRGLPTAQHPEIFRVSQAYARCGVDLGDFVEYDGRPRAGRVLLWPPPAQRVASLPPPPRRLTIGLTGWTLDQPRRKGWNVDCLLPLSDHADFPQLLQLVEQVSPRRVYCLHGPASFAEQLRSRGWTASALPAG